MFRHSVYVVDVRRADSVYVVYVGRARSVYVVYVERAQSVRPCAADYLWRRDLVRRSIRRRNLVRRSIRRSIRSTPDGVCVVLWGHKLHHRVILLHSLYTAT